MKTKLFMYVALCFVLVFTLGLMAGCKGSDGSVGAIGTPGATGATGANGVDGANGATGATGATGANGTNGQDLIAGAGPANEQCLICHSAGAVADINAMHTPSPLSATTAPAVTDANGNININQQSAAQLAGLGDLTGNIVSVNTATAFPVVTFQVKDSAGRLVTGLTGSTNIKFTMAKLVTSGTGSFPDYWDSYMVTATSRPTSECIGAAASNYGVTESPAGTYAYTVGRDVSGSASLTHRIGIQISGTVPGGSLNSIAANLIADFVPAGGAATAHDIVAATSCNKCHYKLGTTTPHGGRVDTKYCVTCHTYQRAIGRTVTMPTATGLAGTTYLVGGQADLATDPTMSSNGFAQLELVTLVHKIHMGEDLALGGENPAVNANEVTYPQDIRKCTTCHAGPQGANWNTKPSRKACGSCHDNISWASSVPTGLVAHRTPAGLSGLAQASDAGCAGCHDSAAIIGYHVAVAPPADSVLSNPSTTGNYGNVNAAYIVAAGSTPPAGATTVSYAVSAVTRDANMHPTISFQIKLNGTATSFATYTTGAELFANFVGSPSVYFAWSVPQDNIAAPADFNASASAYIKTVWSSPTSTATTLDSSAAPTYKITINNVIVPDNAKMLTGGVGYTYSMPATQPLTQTNVSGYAYNASNRIGGLIVPAADVWKVATGYSGRRKVVDTNKCNDCHGALGVAPTFHAGQRNDAPTCSFCHNPNKTSSGWSANASTFIHGIHAASKRTVDFNWHAASATSTFAEVTYPGLLSSANANCQACHVAGGYDFSSSIYTSAQSAANMLFSTVTTGTLASSSTSSFAFSPYAALDTNYGSGFSVNNATGVSTPAAGTTLVTSPITAACFSCHDSKADKAHMLQNGGVIYLNRSKAIQ